MPTVEIIARMGTKGINPKSVHGGIPELTPSDIAAAIAMGKISEEARCVSVYSDATIAFPLIVSATLSTTKEMLKQRRFPRFRMGKNLEVL